MRVAGRIAIIAGAIGSMALMLYIGRRNQHYWLLLMFVVWDVAPFVGLALADRWATRSSPASRGTFDLLALIIALGSLALYADVALRPRPQPAARFLLVPAAAWLAIAVAVIAARGASRRR